MFERAPSRIPCRALMALDGCRCAPRPLDADASGGLFIFGSIDAMAYSQTDIDALKDAIATGARKVKFGSGPDSREVEYRTLSEMLATLAIMQPEVTPTARPAPRVSYISHSRD